MELNLSQFSLDELLLAGTKSEVESEALYRTLAGRVKNFMLRDRLAFLAEEEKKHAKVLRSIFRERFPGREPAIPPTTPVPLPSVRCDDRSPVSDILLAAMDAEAAAASFYSDLAPFFPESDEIRRMLTYLAHMERGHYQMLEGERRNALDIEEADEHFPMFHIGP